MTYSMGLLHRAQYLTEPMPVVATSRFGHGTEA